MNMNNERMLENVLKTAQMGRFGIETVLEKAIGPGLKQQLRQQKSQYDDIENEANALARRHGLHPKGLNPAQRYMTAAMSRVSIAGGERDSKIAGMLIHGNAMGLIKGMKYLNRANGADDDIQALARKLVAREQENIRAAQPYL